MEYLFKSIGVLCVTAYIIGILTNFIPLGYTQKAIRLTVAIYIITSVFIPLKNFEFAIDYSQPDTVEYVEQAQENIIEETKNYIENSVSRQLYEKSISYNSVEVHIHKQSGGLEIESIYIYGVPPKQRRLVEDTMYPDEKIVFGE